MDIKNLQKITDELNFAVEKLEEFEGLDELPQILEDLEKESKKLIKFKISSLLFSFLICSVLGVFIGYFSSYKYTTNSLAKVNLEGFVVADFNNKVDLYLPTKNLDDVTKSKKHYIFTYKK